MTKVQIYSKGYCPYCKVAKATLGDLGLSFEEFDITNNASLEQEMRKRSHRRTVPQIFINDHHVGGNDDLQIALRNDALKDILQANAAAA